MCCVITLRERSAQKTGNIYGEKKGQADRQEIKPQILQLNPCKRPLARSEYMTLGAGSTAECDTFLFLPLVLVVEGRKLMI